MLSSLFKAAWSFTTTLFGYIRMWTQSVADLLDVVVR
jgi:hypothetical protein